MWSGYVACLHGLPSVVRILVCQYIQVPPLNPFNTSMYFTFNFGRPDHCWDAQSFIFSNAVIHFYSRRPRISMGNIGVAFKLSGIVLGWWITWSYWGITLPNLLRFKVVIMSPHPKDGRELCFTQHCSPSSSPLLFSGLDIWSYTGLYDFLHYKWFTCFLNMFVFLLIFNRLWILELHDGVSVEWFLLNGADICFCLHKNSSSSM